MEGSAWVLDARAEGLLNVTQITATGVEIQGGGLLRGVGLHTELHEVELKSLKVDRGAPTLPNLPTDAIIQLQPTAGPDELPVGLASWLQ